MAVAGFGIGKIASKIGNVFKRFKKPNACSFAGDTLVLTSTGFVAIREIEAGNDEVWARDEQTGEMGWQPVLAQYSNPYDKTVSVTTRSSDGTEQTIVSNAIHPYFAKIPENATVVASSEGHVYAGGVESGHWVDAANLQPGFELLSSDESWQTVVSVDVQQKPLNAFNLTVQDYSTYFVAANDEADAVWVHNNCFDELPDGYNPTGKRNDFGQETFEAPNGEILYKAYDPVLKKDRFYDPKVYPPGNGIWRSDFYDKDGNPIKWRNPITNKVEDIPAGTKFHADHILPKKKLEKLPGWDELSPAQRKILQNDRSNFQPLAGSLNCSKGSKCGIDGTDWTHYKGEELPESYKKWLVKEQEKLQAYFVKRIQAMLDSD